MGSRLLLAAAGAVVLLAALMGLLVLTSGEGVGAVQATRDTSAETRSASADRGSLATPPLRESPPAETERQMPAPEAAPSARAPTGGEWSAALRGAVRDRNAHRGIPLVEIVRDDPGERRLKVTTDERGRFEFTTRWPQGPVRLRAVDALSGELLAETVHDHRLSDAGAGAAPLVWELELGPTFLVRLVGAADAATPWKLRVVERPDGREPRAWPWIPAHPGGRADAVRARYLPAVHGPGGISPAWVELVDAEGELGGEARVRSTLGVHEVAVEVGPIRGSLSGRVLDEAGAPVAARLFAVPREDLRRELLDQPSARTGPDGRYFLQGARPGPTRVLVTSDHRAPARAEVEVVGGRESVLDFTLPVVGIAGAIRGELVGPTGSIGPAALVELESAEGGSTARTLEVFAREGEVRVPFAFEDLAQGSYRLRVIPVDGRRYEPPVAEVTAPSEGIEFRTEDVLLVVDPSRRLLLRAFDRESGLLLERWDWLPRLGSHWIMDIGSGEPPGSSLRLPLDFPLAFVVSSPGHVPVTASVSAARPGDDGPVLDVQLAPGWGAALLVLDASRVLGYSRSGMDNGVPMRGLEGARIVAGGRTLGISDAHGLALCASDAPIEAFEVLLPGWSRLSVRGFLGHARTPNGLGFVLMIRD